MGAGQYGDAILWFQLIDIAVANKRPIVLVTDDHPLARELEGKLRPMIDPEEVNIRSKSDQRAPMEKLGGIDAVRKAGVFSVSPVPGKAPQLEQVEGTPA